VRDYLATWCGDDRAGQAVALSVELGRRAVTAEQSAAAYAVAAWAAWALGWGAWSRLCLERASSSMPGYTLAALIKQGLERGVGPELVREAARGTARRLNEMRTEHDATRERELLRRFRAADGSGSSADSLRDSLPHYRAGDQDGLSPAHSEQSASAHARKAR
jgi:hypothetical protein